MITRFGIVLGEGGGALGQMTPMFRRFLGGPLGHGKAVVLLDSPGGPGAGLQFVQEHAEIHGPVNFTAPRPVRNWELTKARAGALHRPTTCRPRSS